MRAVVIADEVNACHERAGFILLWPPVKGVDTDDSGWSCFPLDGGSSGRR
jgi:hypothetical protein